MKKIFYYIFITIFLIGCAKKSYNINTLPQNIDPQVKEALDSYKSLMQDKNLDKIVPIQTNKTKKVAQLLLKNLDNPQLARHYAYLLKNQVKITKLAKKRLDVASKLNSVIRKRNDAILEMKKEMQEDDEDSNTNIHLSSVDEDKLKQIFNYQNNSFTINGKYFDNDELIPSRNLRKLMVYLANYLNSSPTKSIELLSYTDGVGSEAYSLDLALRRANRIKEMLVDNGVDEDRVIVTPKGAINFLASNDNKDGRIQNNRIIIKIKSINS